VSIIDRPSRDARASVGVILSLSLSLSLFLALPSFAQNYRVYFYSRWNVSLAKLFNTFLRNTAHVTDRLILSYALWHLAALYILSIILIIVSSINASLQNFPRTPLRVPSVNI